MPHRLLKLSAALALSLPAQAFAQGASASPPKAAAPAQTEPVAPASAPAATAPADAPAPAPNAATPGLSPDRGGELTPEQNAALPPSPLVRERSMNLEPPPPPARQRRHHREDDDAPPSLVSEKAVIGGYGSLDIDYTRMFGKDGSMIGLEGGLILNHRLSFGIGGQIWTNPQNGPNDVDGTERQFDVGILGGTLRYSILTNTPVYVTVGTLVGGGAIMLGPRHHDDDDDDRWDHQKSDRFFVVQPDVTAHLNVLPWMRLGVTAGYRLTAGVDRFGFTESDLNGVLLGGHVQIGRF